MSSKAWSSHSNSPESEHPVKEELHRLVDLLSEYECAHLLSAVGQTVAGERFWEGDSGLFYNEYVKLRYFRIGRNAPRAPAVEHDAFVPLFITKSYPEAERLALPAPAALSARLDETLQRRRSRRNYRDSTIDLGQLSALLQYGCGVTASVPAYGFESLPLRAFPTHGGLQSPEVYLWARAVDGLERGIFHYEPRSHSLELVRRGDFGDQLCALAFGEEYVARAAMVVLVTGMYERLRWKYGERAYRFLCMDAGFLGENLYLVSEGLGLSACAISGFAQDATEELLGIDGKREVALLLLTVSGADNGSQAAEM